MNTTIHTEAAADNPPISMTRESLVYLPALSSLPSGIVLRFMSGVSEAPLWTAIQREAEPFFTVEDDLFTREFGTDSAAIAARCLLALDTETGEAVGTASAWHGGDGEGRGRDWGCLHWVAVRPAFQRRGVARALVVSCLHTMAALGHTRAYLNTSTGRQGAITLYRSVGFIPDR